MNTKLTSSLAATVAAALTVSLSASSAAAGGGGAHIERQQWLFAGFTGQYDKQQLQRGFKVYQESCSNCHGLSRIAWRNLVQPGGPEFPEEAVKALAAKWPNQIPELNDDGELARVKKDKDGKVTGFEYVKRAAKLSDPILGPYANEAQARAAQNGALPPDLSLITKARNVENHSGWVKHVAVDMPKDMLVGYQEGGADYLYALLTSYADPPANFTLGEGMQYNAAFPGNQIAMIPPLSKDNVIAYEEGAGAKASLEQNARDIAAFLSWAGDPTLNARKRIGWQVMLYLLITTVLLYLAKKRVWSRIAH
jgi:cytochrome c1